MLYENHILLFRWMYSSVMLLIMSIQSLNDKKKKTVFFFVLNYYNYHKHKNGSPDKRFSSE